MLRAIALELHARLREVIEASRNFLDRAATPCILQIVASWLDAMKPQMPTE